MITEFAPDLLNDEEDYENGFNSSGIKDYITSLLNYEISH